MNVLSRRIASALLLLLFTNVGSAQIHPPTPGAEVSFSFERSGLSVPRFTLTVDNSGTARYEADEVVIPARTGTEADLIPAHHVDRTVTLSRATTEKIFANAWALNLFNIVCASKAKNIADTGTKTLSYSDDVPHGSCTYNYSENKSVVLLTDLFVGIARTLDVGRKLDFQHRFDRLGLDSTMASLTEEVDAGRAVEVGVIAPTLRSLAEDSDVLQRVRQRAVRLLQAAQSPS